MIDKETNFWFFSTVAQVVAATLAVLGALSIFILDSFGRRIDFFYQDLKKIIEDNVVTYISGTPIPTTLDLSSNEIIRERLEDILVENSIYEIVTDYTPSYLAKQLEYVKDIEKRRKESVYKVSLFIFFSTSTILVSIFGILLSTHLVSIWGIIYSLTVFGLCVIVFWSIFSFFYSLEGVSELKEILQRSSPKS